MSKQQNVRSEAYNMGLGAGSDVTQNWCAKSVCPSKRPDIPILKKAEAEHANLEARKRTASSLAACR
jgi:hypothetical protein